VRRKGSPSTRGGGRVWLKPYSRLGNRIHAGTEALETDVKATGAEIRVSQQWDFKGEREVPVKSLKKKAGKKESSNGKELTDGTKVRECVCAVCLVAGKSTEDRYKSRTTNVKKKMQG